MQGWIKLSAVPLAAALIVQAACSSGDGGPGAATSAVAYEGARLVVGDGSVIENGVLVIEGDRILAAGELGSVAVPSGARRVDLSGKTVMPALIDAHGHLGYEGFHTWGAPNYTRENMIDHLDIHAYYGYGAVSSTGTDPDEVALELQRQQKAGEFGGARLLFAAGMGPPGQGPNQLLLNESLAMGRTIVRGADTPEDGREKVREIAALGIPFIKIWVTDRGGTQRKMEPEVYRAIIDEAKQHGIGVVAHMETLNDMKGLLRAGLTGFVHGFFGMSVIPDQELIDLFRETGAWVVPTYSIAERVMYREMQLQDPFFTEMLPPATVERLRKDWVADPPLSAEAVAARRAGLKMVADAGVNIVHGTDGGGLPDMFFGYIGHVELENYQKYGMTPEQIIVAATSRAAQVLGLTDMGTLEAGKSADFVILDANPLETIRNTRTISEVYLRGERVDRDAIRARITSR